MRFSVRLASTSSLFHLWYRRGRVPSHNIEVWFSQPSLLSKHHLPTLTLISIFIMTDLIVDFPSRRSFSKDTITCNKRSRRKAVHFSPMAHICLIEPTEDESSSWYSSKEMKSFRVQNVKNVQEVNRHVLAITSGTFGSDSASSMPQVESQHLMNDCSLVGIENLLTPKIIKKKLKMRRRCVEAVLNEEERQFRTGECDMDRLAAVSAQYSKWSVQRAEQIATLHARM